MNNYHKYTSHWSLFLTHSQTICFFVFSFYRLCTAKKYFNFIHSLTSLKFKLNSKIICIYYENVVGIVDFFVAVHNIVATVFVVSFFTSIALFNFISRNWNELLTPRAHTRDMEID